MKAEDFKFLMGGNHALVVLRCGGKGGRCGAIHGAVIPAGDESLIALKGERPCRCSVTPQRCFTGSEFESLMELIADARAEIDEGFNTGRYINGFSFYPKTFILKPTYGVKHEDVGVLAQKAADAGRIILHMETIED